MEFWPLSVMFKRAIIILCLFAAGCSKQVVVVIHNQTARPVYLRADKEYLIRPGESANTKPPLDQMITITTESGEALRYRVIFPSPHATYVRKESMRIILELALLDNSRLYALPDNQVTAKSSDEQPVGFPLSPVK